MLHKIDWKEAVKLAEHYKATSNTNLYLDGKGEADLPWEYVTAVTAGGSHRLGISVSSHITASHPCGLEFFWYIEFEKPEANGTGSYHIDVERLDRIMQRLPFKAKAQFQKQLTETAEAVSKNAAEYEGIASRQRVVATALRSLYTHDCKVCPANEPCKHLAAIKSANEME